MTTNESIPSFNQDDSDSDDQTIKKYKLSDSIEDSEGYLLLEQIFGGNDKHQQNQTHLDALFEGKCKELYNSLWDKVANVTKYEKHMTTKSRELKKFVLKERIEVEKMKLTHEENSHSLQDIEQENIDIQTQVDKVERAHTILTYELQRSKEANESMSTQLEEIKKANALIVSPELDRLRSALYAIHDEQETTQNEIQKDQSRLSELQEQLDMLKTDQKECENMINKDNVICSTVLDQLKAQRKETEAFEKDVEEVELQVAQLYEKIDSIDMKILSQKEKRKEAENIKTELDQKLELHQETIDHRHRDVESVMKNLDAEKVKTQLVQAKKTELSLAIQKVEEDIRHYLTSSLMKTKQLDYMKRKYLKKKNATKMIQDVIDQLTLRFNESEYAKHILELENEKLTKAVQSLKQEVDTNITIFLAQQSIEKEQRGDLNYSFEEVEKAEADVQHLLTEEKKTSKIICIMNIQHDLKERELARCIQSEKESQAEIKLKESVILDLEKRLTLANNRLKEHELLHRNIEKERDDKLIQMKNSKLTLDEFKEQATKLQSQQEALQLETSEKGKIFEKESISHEASQAQRATLRAELYAARANYKDHQMKLEKQISEIDQLRTSINTLEREIKHQKAQNERIMRVKDVAKSQLADRKNEVLNLQSKSQLYDQVMKQGENVVKKADEDYRSLKLYHDELHRYIEFAQKRSFEKIPVLETKIGQLQKELDIEQSVTEEYCRKLEDPRNIDRWREVGDNVPDEEQLQSKVMVLEQRLSDNREILLEKELIVEEISHLIEKLQLKHEEVKNAKNVNVSIKQANEYQIKQRNLSKSLMAIVGELSMYQATAMKLKEEKIILEQELDACTQNIMRDKPPNQSAFEKLQKRMRERENDENHKPPSNIEGASSLLALEDFSRPTAYVPDSDGIGVPRPVSFHQRASNNCNVVTISPLKFIFSFFVVPSIYYSTVILLHLNPRSQALCDIYELLKVRVLTFNI